MKFKESLEDPSKIIIDCINSSGDNFKINWSRNQALLENIATPKDTVEEVKRVSFQVNLKETQQFLAWPLKRLIPYDQQGGGYTKSQ